MDGQIILVNKIEIRIQIRNQSQVPTIGLMSGCKSQLSFHKAKEKTEIK